MNVIYDKFKVFCKDTESEYELFVDNFKEDDTEIKIKSCARNNSLDRGWIGDLFYNAVSLDVCNPNNAISRDTIIWSKDVLLIKVNIFNDNGCIKWEYTFSKK